MDDLARYNQARCDELARAGVAYSRPFLDLDAASARQVVDPYGLLGDVQGQDVLCLASGGGQQSAAFGLLGARVTVLDLSATQLERDRIAAAHYGLTIRIEQGDMRDLSRFEPASFDLVWHAHSLNFVPDPRIVFQQVARVLRPGGLYRFSCSNPLVMDVMETTWTGQGYLLNQPYIDGAEVVNQVWDVTNEAGETKQIQGPHEFRHTLTTLVNGLVAQGLMIIGLWEEGEGDLAAEPGTWQHLQAIAPPWLSVWTVFRPEMRRG